LQNKKKFYEAELNENVNFGENKEMSDNEEIVDEESVEYEDLNIDKVEDIDETINEVDTSALKFKHVVTQVESDEEEETNIDEIVVVKNQNKQRTVKVDKNQIRNDKREDVDKIERVAEKKKSKNDRKQIKF
jgi:hypothetical protein